MLGDLIGGVIGKIFGGRQRREEARERERERVAAYRLARLQYAKKMEVLRKQAAMKKERAAMMRSIVPLGVAVLVVIALVSAKRKKRKK